LKQWSTAWSKSEDDVGPRTRGIEVVYGNFS
jgi:hypothetical protein